MIIYYSYYALKSLKFHIPRPIAMGITCLQLSQMVVGLVVNFYAYTTKLNGDSCDISYHHLNMGLVMYASYFALFIHFFVQAYFGRKPQGKKATSTSNKNDALFEKNNNNYAPRDGITTRSRATSKKQE